MLVFVIIFVCVQATKMTDKAKKIADIYTKYAPKNITLAEFTNMIEQDPKLLDAIGGKFSTRNPELTQLFKARVKGNDIIDNILREKLHNSISESAMEQVAQEHAQIYADIICNDDEMLKMAWTFDALTQKQKRDFAKKIIEGINEHFGIKDKIKVLVGRRSLATAFLEDSIDFVIKIISGHKLLKLERHGYYNKLFKEISVLKYEDFVHFVALLSHEYGHFIDNKYPNLGMLGAQISFYGEDVYSSMDGVSVYMANPTERSSHKIANVTENLLSRELRGAARQKPQLYMESIRILADYSKTKIKAMDFAYRKQFKAIEKAKQEYNSAKEKALSKLYPNQDIANLPTKEYVDAVSKINKQPDIKIMQDNIRKLGLKIPQEYEDLKSNLEYYNKLLSAYANDRKLFYDLIAPKEY